MSSLFGGTSTSGFGANQATSTADNAIVSPPADTISSLNFTPVQNSNFIVSTSWSGQVQCWEVGIQGLSVMSQPKAETKHDYPLDSDWYTDGTKILTCGCDRTVKVWDLQSNQQMTVGTHDAPVRHVRVIDPGVFGAPVVVSGKRINTEIVCALLH
jgi:mRNA export factor